MNGEADAAVARGEGRAPCERVTGETAGNLTGEMSDVGRRTSKADLGFTDSRFEEEKRNNWVSICRNQKLKLQKAAWIRQDDQILGKGIKDLCRICAKKEKETVGGFMYLKAEHCQILKRFDYWKT